VAQRMDGSAQGGQRPAGCDCRFDGYGEWWNVRKRSSRADGFRCIQQPALPCPNCQPLHFQHTSFFGRSPAGGGLQGASDSIPNP
ncbi:MAG: hypothetical protein ACK5O5_01740, partial [bacterium]